MFRVELDGMKSMAQDEAPSAEVVQGPTAKLGSFSAKIHERSACGPRRSRESLVSWVPWMEMMMGNRGVRRTSRCPWADELVEVALGRWRTASVHLQALS